MKSLRDSGKPNPEVALASYKKLARQYDGTCRLIDPVRRKTIELLKLSNGETVIDIASGTGLSLPALSQAVGPKGRVIAIELCPDMAAIAQHRIEVNHLDNVTQIVAAMETASIDGSADALLFHYTHDVLRSGAAIERIFRAAKPGARVAIAGFKLPTDWRRIFNPWHRYRAWGYLSTFEGVLAPWDRLLPYIDDFQIHQEIFIGSGYIATARASGSTIVTESLSQTV
jgi:ubiquinone/menaquinone biosynthesis C-methylase UbiE